MKKCLIMSFLFLLITTPVLAKNSTSVNYQLDITKTPAEQTTISPTYNQVKNVNEVKTQNQDKYQQINNEIKEDEHINQIVNTSNQVHELVETVGVKGSVGQKVEEIAQNQIKLQDEIESDIFQLNSRGMVYKFVIGSDKKLIKSIEQKMEQNRLLVQQLEELKLQTQNTNDLQQFQKTIDLITYQNISLQNKIDKENESNGMFNWLVGLFD